jgi:hypothetical protein
MTVLEMAEEIYIRLAAQVDGLEITENVPDCDWLSKRADLAWCAANEFADYVAKKKANPADRSIGPESRS